MFYFLSNLLSKKPFKIGSVAPTCSNGWLWNSPQVELASRDTSDSKAIRKRNKAPTQRMAIYIYILHWMFNSEFSPEKQISPKRKIFSKNPTIHFSGKFCRKNFGGEKTQFYPVETTLTIFPSAKETMGVGIPTPITNHQIGSQAFGSYNLRFNKKNMTIAEGWW